MLVTRRDGNNITQTRLRHEFLGTFFLGIES